MPSLLLLLLWEEVLKSMKKWLLVFVALLFCFACTEEDLSLRSVSFDSISYQNKKHESLQWEKKEISKWHLLDEAHLLYVRDLDDSLWVFILEFENDAFALAYYINSGRFQGTLPIVKGFNLEQSIRSGRHIFVFKHKRFYPHDRRLLEEYVQQFPGYRGGLPQEFLSLPFENREPGKTSVQIDLFHGEKISFPMFVQRYRNADVYWSVARSFESVDNEDWLAWVDSIKKTKGLVTYNESILKFESGNETRAIASRLGGGRVICIWGPLDSKKLEKLFFEISERVYSAKY